MTIIEAARRSGVSEWGVKKAIERGALKAGTRVVAHHDISEEQFAEWMQARTAGNGELAYWEIIKESLCSSRECGIEGRVLARFDCLVNIPEFVAQIQKITGDLEHPGNAGLLEHFICMDMLRREGQ